MIKCKKVINQSKGIFQFNQRKSRVCRFRHFSLFDKTENEEILNIMDKVS